jgi:hypothetical protein
MTIFYHRIRLSPSGPYCDDGSGTTILTGTGTPGLILRAWGTSAMTGITSAGDVLLTITETVSPAYKYDIKAGIFSSQAAGETFSSQLQYTTDGAVWTPIVESDGTTTGGTTTDNELLQTEGWLHFTRRFDPTAMGITSNIQGFRWHVATAAGGATVLGATAFLRVEQYLGDP